MQKRFRRTSAIFLIVIAAVAASTIFVWWWNNQRTPEEEFKSYSDYGVSFEYPKKMEISEDTPSTTDSGILLGQLGNGELELVRVSWLTTESAPDLETSLNNTLLNLEFEGLTIEKGQLKNHTTLNGHEMLYQSFTATDEETITFQGISGVWYCSTSNRSFEFILMWIQNDQDINSRFQHYINSFNCH